MAKKSGKAKRGAGKAKRTARPAKRAVKTKGRAGAKRRVAAKRPPARRTSATTARPPSPPPDPLREMRELAKRIIDVTMANDDDATLALYADNVESVERGAPPMVGIDAIKQKFQMWRGMTSRAEFHPRKVCVDGNVIMIEWEGTVTLSPSGKTVTLEEVAVHEIENGKIARERFYYDPSVLQQ
jgi:ketosteroid isomerase-like protein